ncbi:MAG: hypothetical protein ACRERE_06950 [Candidatus Entotheonellia bacterium]
MSRSLCLNCGVLKVGAFDECPECGEGPPDADVALCFTTHHLTEHELEQIGLAVKTLNQIEVNEDTRFHAFLHFVSRKWPKVLEYNINLVEPELSENVDAVYRTHLADLPGQQTAELERPHWAGDGSRHGLRSYKLLRTNGKRVCRTECSTV